jgi:iron complex transport system substrate-binding protein
MRIVSLVPSITEALCMLGLSQSIVGITDYCLHPAEVVRSKKRVGGTKNPSIREIRDLRPDLVLLNTDENRLETYNELVNVGCPTLIIETDSLDQVESAWLLLGEATGTLPAAVEQRNKIIAARARSRAALCGIARISTLIVVWRDPWMASGSGTYPDALLSECGFRNVLYGVGKKWVKVDIDGNRRPGTVSLPERPDLILLPTEPYHFDCSNRDNFHSIGVERENVHVVDGLLLSWWLSRTAPALEHFRLRRSQFVP